MKHYSWKTIKERHPLLYARLRAAGWFKVDRQPFVYGWV